MALATLRLRLLNSAEPQDLLEITTDLLQIRAIAFCLRLSIRYPLLGETKTFNHFLFIQTSLYSNYKILSCQSNSC